MIACAQPTPGLTLVTRAGGSRAQARAALDAGASVNYRYATVRWGEHGPWANGQADPAACAAVAVELQRHGVFYVAQGCREAHLPSLLAAHAPMANALRQPGAAGRGAIWRSTPEGEVIGVEPVKYIAA